MTDADRPSANCQPTPPTGDACGRPAIVKTTRTPSGQIVDWVRRESQAPGGRIASPPPLSAPDLATGGSTHGAATFELADPAVERGPAGTVPLLRGHASMAHDGERARPRKRAVDARSLQSRAPRPPVAPPDPLGYYHATTSEWTTCYGCQTTLNVWAPECELPVDHSLSQFGIQNYDNGKLQSLEAGWIVSRGQFGDALPHVFVYFTNDGYVGDQADGVRGYNRDVAGWVQYDENIFPGALIGGLSQFGSTQDEITIKFQLWEGNWWFQVQGIWLGYYPATLFQGQWPAGTSLGDHASWVAFWGEVYSGRADATQTTTDMGSGRFAEEGWQWSAYQRNARVQTGRAGLLVDSDGLPSDEDSAYYDILQHVRSGSSWGSYFWYGGPGHRPHVSKFRELTGEVVRIIIGGAGGTLVTIDAQGHIRVIPMPQPDDLRQLAHDPALLRQRMPLENQY